jgi:hypothetical protein
MILKIIANLNGGDLVTPDNELTYKIYGSADNYASPIATLGSALNDAKVSVTAGVVTIDNVDVGTENEFKISSVDAAGNEAELSDAVSSGVLDILENSAYVFSLKELVSSTDDKFSVRRVSDNATENYNYSELIDGTLNTFGASSDINITAITDISGNKTVTQSDPSKQFKILSSGSFYKGVFETGAFRTMFNQDLDLGNFGLSVVFNCNENNSNIISYTEGNNDGTYLFLLERNGSNEIRLRLNIIGTGAPTLYFTGNLNLNGRNVITLGVRNGNNLFFKINSEPIENRTLAGNFSMDKVDEDIGGRNSGVATTSYSFFKRFATPPNEELINQTNNYLVKKFEIPSLSFMSNTTVISDNSQGNTGVFYDEDNDELIISNYNGARQNRLLRFDRETLTQVGVINVNQTVIQGNTKIGDTYYVGRKTLYGYDVNGNTQGSITLPVDPDGQCMVTFFDGHIYTISDAKLVKISFPDLEVVSELDGINSAEGLAVNSKYIAIGGGNKTSVINYSGELLAQFPSSQPEGICFDVFDNIYVNRDQGLHGDIPDGNKLWKYKIK